MQLVFAYFMRLVELLLVSILSEFLAALFLPGVYLIKNQYGIFSSQSCCFHFYNMIYDNPCFLINKTDVNFFPFKTTSNAFSPLHFKSTLAGGTDSLLVLHRYHMKECYQQGALFTLFYNANQCKTWRAISAPY